MENDTSLDNISFFLNIFVVQSVVFGLEILINLPLVFNLLICEFGIVHRFDVQSVFIGLDGSGVLVANE